MIYLTQKGIFNILFCVFFLFISSFGHDAVANESNSKIQNCNTSDTKTLESVNQSVQFVYQQWQWNAADNLRGKSTILIQFENYWLLYGLQNINSSHKLQDLNVLIPNHLFCKANGHPVSFILIKRSEANPQAKKREFFTFIHPFKADEAGEYVYFKKFFGKILLINLDTLNESNVRELELTIAHEAMHLFGQDTIQNSEPAFHPAYEAIETEIKEKNTSTVHDSEKGCHDSIQNFNHQSGRDYLEFKLKCSMAFKQSVIKETCLNLQLIKFIKNTSKSNPSNRLHVAVIMKEMLSELEIRTNLYEDSDLPLEWYWYLLEGVPQFMEQKILLQQNSDRIIQQYESYCQQKEGHEEYFYPLLTGAAIWHGLDYLFDSTEDWGYMATQSEYNIPSNENPKFWFNNFKLLLNNKIAQTVMN